MSVEQWLKEIMEKHPKFDPTTWTPLTVRFPDTPVKELWKMVASDD